MLTVIRDSEVPAYPILGLEFISIRERILPQSERAVYRFTNDLISKMFRDAISLSWFLLKVGIYLILALTSQNIVVVAYQQF